MSETADPIIAFYRFMDGARPPQRGDRSAAGTLPTRAFQYCEPVLQASSFGWYVFPPMNFSLMWDGTDVVWTWEGEEQWHPLKTAVPQEFGERFDAVAPKDAEGYAPPFLGAGLEPGMVQVWSGLIAKTAPGWSVLVRGPANLPKSASFEVLEGIIETDWWFGPLFTNLRLKQTGVPIMFDADTPYMQVQPLQRTVYSDAVLNRFRMVERMEDMTPEDWQAFRETIVERGRPQDREKGDYAQSARRRRKREPGQGGPHSE